ncbi:30S ribosomal protein THX [Empedobacter tilapiae]|uniref:30S ribosomal protein THX n=1 Tax=Empedobacter tilapiae TaxID=2491114 RepID=A0A4Z1BCZ8_9FLAO|nr:30S ribosomal protein THX [Empedobacter tilapiae]TGN29693.1 30S ribosomal protein THX [Empedobacter tilapiae]
MGKGDKKTRRGKIVNGSYGVKRPRNKYYYEEEVVEEKPAKKAKK